MGSRFPRAFPASIRLALLALGALAPAVSATTPSAPTVDTALALFHTRGKSAEAQAAFEALARTQPGLHAAHLHLGLLAFRRDDPDAALVHLEKAVQLAPDHSETYRALGDAYGRAAQKKGIFGGLGLGKKCLAAYEKSVALDPANVAARSSLFEFYRQAPGFAGGSEEKAADQVAAVRRLDPWRGHVLAASLHVSRKQYDLALAEFDTVLRATPDHYLAHYQIGRLALDTGRFLDRGLASLRRCLELPPPAGAVPPATVHWRLGQLLEKTRDRPGARAAYERALALDPTLSAAAEALKKLL